MNGNADHIHATRAEAGPAALQPPPHPSHASCSESEAPARRPRLGFVGLGWIGGQRMKVLADAGLADVVAVCDPDRRRLDQACRVLAAEPVMCRGFERLLEQPLDGIVIATPNAMHESQAAAALERGIAVFSQKPLAVSATGTKRVLDLALRKNLPLAVDWSYRYLHGVPELKALIETGELGVVTAAELCFHNAYGPDAAWYYDAAQAGGGCLLDLGCHLLDLCHWLLGARGPEEVRARCFDGGRRLEAPVAQPEDFVMAEIGYSSGLHAHLSCSWRASVGRGAVFGCRVFGTSGGASIHNVGGSFYDFTVELNHGAQRVTLAAPPDAWPGRALLAWTRRLQAGDGCGPEELAQLATTADLIDAIYGRA